MWCCRWLVSPSSHCLDRAALRPQVWEKRSGECLHTLRDHAGPLNSAVWCSDGSLVATGGADRDITVYDMEAVAALGTRGGPGECLLVWL